MDVTKGNNTIILLEDDHYLSEVYRITLENRGYQVIHQDNSEGIVELIRHHFPALVITDLVMPEHDGMEGIFAILENCNIPVIAISAYEHYLEIARPVVSQIVQKPITADELVLVVERVLNMHNTHSASA